LLLRSPPDKSTCFLLLLRLRLPPDKFICFLLLRLVLRLRLRLPPQCGSLYANGDDSAKVGGLPVDIVKDPVALGTDGDDGDGEADDGYSFSNCCRFLQPSKTIFTKSSEYFFRLLAK
jgi:hypothetical protein